PPRPSHARSGNVGVRCRLLSRPRWPDEPLPVLRLAQLDRRAAQPRARWKDLQREQDEEVQAEKEEEAETRARKVGAKSSGCPPDVTYASAVVGSALGDAAAVPSRSERRAVK